MKIQHRRFFGASLLVLAITALMGCTKDPGLNKDPDSPTSVTMNLKLPSPTTMQSYGIDEDRENEVVRLDVFIFDEANNILKNVGHQTIRSFSQSGPTITALVSIDRAVAKQRFCIVANGSDAMLSGITTKAELDALEISSAKMPHQLFVMSAVSELLTVTAADFATKFTFSLIRCVSRLDVKVDKTKVTNFKIKSVKIINARSGGYLYQKKDATGKVTPPTGTTMLDYDKINVALSEQYGFTAKLYAFENYNATLTDIANTTSIVLGGEYGGLGITTYYRIDVRDADKALQLLRNNRYDITINQVDGPGFPDEGDAETGANANLHYTIEVWKQSDVDAEFDGTLYLGVSERQLQVSRDASGGTILVETNADSYTLSSPVDDAGRQATWLSVTSEAKTINYTTTTNYSGASRTAYFYVQAGTKLKIKVSVTQTYGTLDIIKLSTTSVSVPVGGSGSGTAPATTVITSGRDNVTWTINPQMTKFGDQSNWLTMTAGQLMTGTGNRNQSWEVKADVSAMTLSTASRSAVIHIDAKDNSSGVVEHYKFTVVQLNHSDIVLTPERLYIAYLATDYVPVALSIKANCTWKAYFVYGNGHAAYTINSDVVQPNNRWVFTKGMSGHPYPATPSSLSWYHQIHTGDAVLYIKVLQGLTGDGYVHIESEGGDVIRRVRLHMSDYKDVEVNGYHILDRNMGASYDGGGNRTVGLNIVNVAGYKYQFGRVPDGYETVITSDVTTGTLYVNNMTGTIPNSIPPYATEKDMYLNPWSLVIAGNDSWMSVASNTPADQRTPGSFWDKNAILSTAALDIEQTNQTGARTFFDPCPEGYRVPTAKELRHIFTKTAADGPGYNTISDFMPASTSRWIMGSKDGTPVDVCFPASGALIFTNSTQYANPTSTTSFVSSYKTECYYLTSSPAGTLDRFHYLFFDNNKVEMRNVRHPTIGASYATGLLSVRCVRNN